MNTDMPAQQVFELLRKFESRNITLIESDGSWPVVWSRARGVHVWDSAGRKYLDLTAAFGVAAAGHANPSVVKAGQRQIAQLTHAMGDVHPHALKAQLASVLSSLTFERWSRRRTPQGRPSVSRPRARMTGKTIFCSAGFEAVEAAIKTAMLATGKAKIIAFDGAYHGLGYGTLNVTHREHFRTRFCSQLAEFGCFLPFPSEPSHLDVLEQQMRRVLRDTPVGAVLVEPVQVRAGVRFPPPDLLPILRSLCDEFGALFILDEIYTGFGRTGKWFACEHSKVIPDVVCLGKGLTGGFPLSACVGRSEVMDAAWPPATGDPIHTSTFLGHPVGCAMALAQINEIIRLGLVAQSARMGRGLSRGLLRLRTASSLSLSARSMGLLAGLEVRCSDGSPAPEVTFRIVKQLLKRGIIVLPDGDNANVISLTPPLTVTQRQLDVALNVFAEVLAKDSL